jgi:hypothetical protein
MLAKTCKPLICAATLALLPDMASALTCKEFQRGLLLGDTEVAATVRKILDPAMAAEHVDVRAKGDPLWGMQVVRIQQLCQGTPDDTIESLAPSLAKAAARDAEAEAEMKARQEESGRHALENTLQKLHDLQVQAKLPPPPDSYLDKAVPTTLTTEQRGAVADNARRCWSTDPGMLDLDRMEVLLTITTDGAGVVRRAVVAQNDQARVNGNARLKIFAERAVRAALHPSCASPPLPQQILGRPNTITFQFQP